MSRALLLPVLLLGIMMSGCSTYHKSQRNGSIDIMMKADMKANISVNMNRVLKGSASVTRLFGIEFGATHFADGVSYNGGDGGGLFGEGLAGLAKSAAAYNAVKGKKDVDVLVAPQYVIKKTNVLYIYTKVTASVTGYAGKIKGIRSK